MGKRKRRHTQTLAEELQDLYDNHPRATEWTADQIAEHLSRNVRSVKEHPLFRRQLADTQGVDLTEPDRRVLIALADVSSQDGRLVTVDEVAKEAKLSPGLTRRRLRTLRELGFAFSRIGEAGGYRVTDEGKKQLRQTRKRRRTD